MGSFVRGVVLLLFWSITWDVYEAMAQISLTPKRVVIQAASKAGELLVSNGSGVVQEIKVSAEFGYPVFDRFGEMQFLNRTPHLDRLDAATPTLEAFSLDSMLSVFPKQFLLEPGSTQLVRFYIDRAWDRPEGMYWTRVMVESYEHNAEQQSNFSGQTVGTKVAFRVHQSLPVYYQHGTLETSLMLMEQILEPSEENMYLRSRFLRKGNSPFMGKVTTTIRSTSEMRVSETSQTFFCHLEDWLVTELPIEMAKPDTLDIRYQFIPSYFDRRTGQMQPANPFEIRQTLIPGVGQ